MAKVVICGLDTSTLPKLTNQEINDLMKKLKAATSRRAKSLL